MTRVARRSKADPLAELAPLLTEFGGHRAMIKTIQSRSGELKKKLMGILERAGKPDDKGSLWLEFDEPIGGFTAVCRQRRAKVLLDPDRATEILEAKGVLEACTDVDITIDADKMPLVIAVLKKARIYDEVVTVTERLSDDKIMALYFSEKDSPEPTLTADDIDAMFAEEVSWAFVPREVK
jgi:hypothetical protein